MIMCVEMINLMTAMKIIVMMVRKEVRFHIESDKMNRQNSTCSWFNFPHVLVQELVNIFHKGPVSKHFRLFRPYGLKQLFNSIPQLCRTKAFIDSRKSDCGYVPIKCYLEKQATVWI